MNRAFRGALRILAVLLPLAAGAAADPAEPIERLLNSRSAGSPHAYATAADEVAAAAKKGRPLQKYIIALISREAGAPPAARISAATRERYFAESRPAIRQLAEKRNNPLAWYLLAVDTGDTNLLVTIPQRMFTQVDSTSLMAIPFFILSGNLMERGGISRRLVLEPWFRAISASSICASL